MELRIQQNVLLNLLARAQGIVDKKSTINVLAHVLLETVGSDSLRVRCTDYDTGLVAYYPVDVITPGTVAVNAKKFFEIAKSLPNDMVEITVGANYRVDLRCGRSRFKLSGITPDDFPAPKEFPEVPGIAIDRSVLLDMVEKTIFSVSADDTRMNLNGVYLRVEAHNDDPHQYRVTMVSTDGHRLSRVTRDLIVPDPLERPIDAIVHRRGINELRRILDGPEDTVRLFSYENDFVVRFGNATLFVRQIDDTFPEYERVIPKNVPVKVEIPKADLHQAIARVATLATVKAAGVRLAFEPGQAVLSTNNAEYGEARAEIDIDYTGDPVVVGFNYRYLLDVLNVLNGAMVSIRMVDEFSPGLIESDGDPGATFVVMPMRI